MEESGETSSPNFRVMGSRVAGSGGVLTPSGSIPSAPSLNLLRRHNSGTVGEEAQRGLKRPAEDDVDVDTAANFAKKPSIAYSDPEGAHNIEVGVEVTSSSSSTKRLDPPNNLQLMYNPGYGSDKACLPFQQRAFTYSRDPYRNKLRMEMEQIRQNIKAKRRYRHDWLFQQSEAVRMEMEEIKLKLAKMEAAAKLKEEAEELKENAAKLEIAQLMATVDELRSTNRYLIDKLSSKGVQ